MDPLAPPDPEAVKFLRAAERGDASRVERLIAKGVPPNSRDLGTGATAMHYAAAHGARGVLRVLLKTGRCDFLIRDKGGRLPSELAGLYGRDPAVARLLLKKEVDQARARSLQLHRRADRVSREDQKSRVPSRRPIRRSRDHDIDRER